MLTATYSIVAMSVEQANVRASLKSFHQLIQKSFEPEKFLTPGQVEYACEAMQRLVDAFQWRKVELFLIPAVRRLTRAVDQLLVDLDALTLAATNAMGGLFERVARRPVDTREEVGQFCAAADLFCSALLTRLEREECELFPVARAVVPCETWFSIAHSMLASHGDDDDEPLAPPPPAAAPARIGVMLN